MAKKVLIVYAHESPASFNAAAKDAAVAALTAQGCTVEVSDLYAMKFKVAATTEDITGGVKDAENFCYAKEVKLASEEGRLADDIKKEQEKLKEADLVIFQFPMYWASVPAVMKGWMDRVLGFAYAQEKRYSEGIFKDKKAMLSFTTDCPESVYSDTGINGDINVTLWPLQNGILNYCGFQVFAPQIFWDPATGSPESRSSMLEGWRTRLQNLCGEAPVYFAPLDYFDKEKGFLLKPEVKEKFASKECGLTVGIHMGKPLPANSQTKAGV
ncbi:NAD(P)H dehydrogenase [quinone] 1-like [Oreochromis niloticus]|uniref:NAD(P)H dehydrogenase [quinone] 1-like n=1 Tax=Oreochromis niloticus TaxID=8128 RepID=UPI000904D7EF|nr:NAD(P)H dehydrogenase [quinone] 1-like [Oreochromis niloticus]